MPAKGNGLEPKRNHRLWPDLLALTACCFIAYFIGLANHGLTNWQESQRALVAREMQRSGDWLVPTINGQPYLAKPPMFYWVQVGIAELRGAQTGVFELRLTAALAGLAGVIATYFVVRMLLSARDEDPADRGQAREAALWSALFLATGILYTRSSRIGELDILLVPFVVIAVGAIARAWQVWRNHKRTSFGAVGLAVLAGAGAALTKGPPALAVIAAAGYGPIVLHALSEARWAAGSNVQSAARHRRLSVIIGVIAGLAAGIASASLWSIRNAGDGIGCLILAVTCGVLASIFVRSLVPPAAGMIFRAFARTHPIATLGLPLLALWGWGRLVAARIGPEMAAFWAEKEADDNLNILVPESPVKNLEAMSFGAGLGSILAIAAVVWLVWRRPRLSPAWLVAVAWVGLGFAIFTLLGKGIGRYLTPLWPGLSILAGLFAARMLSRDPHAARARAVLASIIVLAAAISGWWYGFGREQYIPERSPRAMIHALMEQGRGDRKFATFEYWSAALDFYAQSRVQPVGDIQIRAVTAGGAPWTIEQLRDDLANNGARIVLMRENQDRDAGHDRTPAAERLHAAGLVVTPIENLPRFTVDSGKSEMIAAVVDLPAAAGAVPAQESAPADRPPGR